jgi:hypothetical protein
LTYPATAVLPHLQAQALGVVLPPLRMDSQVKYGLLSRGEASIFMRFPPPSYREKIWDHCAGFVIVEEAGGKVGMGLLVWWLVGLYPCVVVGQGQVNGLRRERGGGQSLACTVGVMLSSGHPLTPFCAACTGDFSLVCAAVGLATTVAAC